MAFPSSLPSYTTPTSTQTLAAGNHTALHTQEEADITALATKVGTGASTPASGVLLRGNGSGTSAWSQAQLSSDVTGVLATSNGGTGQTNLTGLPIASPVITGTVPGSATYTTPVLTQPVIADFSSATHSHTNNAGGGTLNAATALQSASITASRIGTDSSWSWTAYTPVYTNLTVGTGTHQSYWTQIGKTVIVRIGFAFSTGSSMGTNPSFTLPVASIATYTLGEHIGGMRYVANAAGYMGYVQWKSTADAFLLSLGASSVDTTITATVPNTWGTTGQIYGTIIYEAQ